MTSYVDDQTGAKVVDLTPEASRAQVGYPTHPMWTNEMEYLVFQSERDGSMQPHALHLKTGHIRRLTDGETVCYALEPKHGRLYYVVGRELRVLNVSMAFRNMATPRRIETLPNRIQQVGGGISLDSKGDLLYLGGGNEADKKWAVASLNLTTASWQLVTEVDFPVGHVQANPAITRVIMFCHETGGLVPQRIWVVNANGAGLRPFYKHTCGEWVTHEVWWGGMRALFTIWPYDKEHEAQPHGAASADLAAGKLSVLSQFRAWHIQGSQDNRWVVADDHDRNIWLIQAANGERRLLVGGYPANAFDTRPHPTFTPDGKGVVFSCSRDGKEHVHMAALPRFESLPPAK